MKRKPNMRRITFEFGDFREPLASNDDDTYEVVVKFRRSLSSDEDVVTSKSAPGDNGNGSEQPKPLSGRPPLHKTATILMRQARDELRQAVGDAGVVAGTFVVLSVSLPDPAKRPRK